MALLLALAAQGSEGKLSPGVVYSGLATRRASGHHTHAAGHHALHQAKHTAKLASKHVVPVVPVEDNYDAAQSADEMITKALEHGVLSAAQAKAITAAAKVAAEADTEKVAAARKIIEAAKEAEAAVADEAAAANTAAAEAAKAVTEDEKKLHEDEVCLHGQCSCCARRCGALCCGLQCKPVTYCGTDVINALSPLAVHRKRRLCLPPWPTRSKLPCKPPARRRAAAGARRAMLRVRLACMLSSSGAS